MVDSLRSGGFGSPSLSYGTRGSGFSQYRIGDNDGENLAYLDKLSAQTAWQNGQITDETYLAALQDYVDALDEDSSSYISAVNQLEDATWNIGRNRLVIAVNESGTGRGRIRALSRLQAYDRRWRSTMVRGNEQFREMTSRIEDIGEQIRAARWGLMRERYNAEKLSDAQMLAFARQMVRAAGDRPDAATYRAYVTQYENAILDDQIQDAIDAWEAAAQPSRKLAGRVEQLYRERMSKMNPDSPAYERYAEALEKFTQNVDARVDALEYERNRSAYQAGRMGDEEWLSYLFTRVQREKKGSVERIRARDAFINASFGVAENALKTGVASGERDVSDLIDFYGSSLAVMDLDSSRAKSLLAEIERLRSQGFEGLERIDISSNAGRPKSLPGLGGHWVMPSGVGVQDGYISQHDGSTFAKTNCGMAAAAMLAWDVTGGGLKVTGGELRYYSGDREGGTWTNDVVKALGVVGVGGREYHGMSLSTFRRRIARGLPAVLQGTNAMLPPNMRFGYDGDHSVFVARIKEHQGQTFYWVMDPNGPGGDYTGAWWSEDQLFAFGWQGSYSGSVVFAGKSGKTKPIDPDTLPPIQRFDTDYMGRSTLGRGGGASRSEAGPRQDWSKGKKAWKLQKAAGGRAAVLDFLGAIDSVERNLTPERQGEVADPANLESEQARHDRAARILARNDGDARRAMIEWFTAQSPDADPSTWTKSERWYANAASRKLGLEKVTPKLAAVGEDEEGALPPTPGEVAGADPERPEPLETGLDPDLDRAAQGILRRLGVEPTTENVSIVASWIRAESGDVVEGNNPLNLRTPGQEDLPGQFGRSEDGVALFDSLEDGLDAAADEIRATMPGLAGVLRSGDPGAAMAVIADSGWSDDPAYASVITQTYNQLPGAVPLISRAGASPYLAPASWSDIVRTHPDAALMFEVDPFDEVQQGWFEMNRDRAYEAALEGRDSFRYLPPGATDLEGAIDLPLSHVAAQDLLRLSFDYTLETLPPGRDRARLVQEEMERLNSMSAEMDLEAFRRYYDTMLEEHDLALMRDDITTAYNLELDIVRGTNAALGLGPDEDPDITRANRDLEPDDYSFLSDVIDRIQPQSVDPNRPNEYAPSGFPLLAMERDGHLHAEYADRTPTGLRARRTGNLGTSGYATRVTADPDYFFASQGPDGRASYYTQATHPDLFEETRVLDVSTGESITVPRYQVYRQEGDFLPIDSAAGRTYQQVGRQDEPWLELYRVDWSGASKERAEAQAGLIAGPARAFESDILATIASQGGDAFPAVSAAPVEAEGLLQRASLVGHQPGAEGHPTVYRIEMYDSETRDSVTWLSIDDPATTPNPRWIGWMGDKYNQPPPGLVAMNGATWKVTDSADPFEPAQLMIGNEPYDPSTMGPVGQYLGWRGAPGTPGSGADGLGASNADYLYRVGSGTLGPDGTVSAMSLDLEPTPLERARAGTISYNEAAQRILLTAPLGEPELPQPYRTEALVNEMLGGAHTPAPTTPSTAANRRLEAIGSFPGGNQSGAQVSVAEAQANAEAARTAARVEADRAAAALAEANAIAASKVAAVPTPAPGPAPTKTPAPTVTPAPKTTITPPPAPTPYRAPTPAPRTPRAPTPPPPKPLTQQEPETKPFQSQPKIL